MPVIVVRRHHDLGLAKARSLAQTIARRLKSDYGGSFVWKGDVLHFERTGASGSVAVTADDFRVRVELGFLLTPLRSQIEGEIRKFCDEHFARDDGSEAGQPARRTAGRGRGTRPS
jgi:putative polyhydroxyalkanoate system protein